jgi:hypothetical protein
VAEPQLKRLVSGFPSRRSWFAPGSAQVKFEVDKVALGQVFSEDFVSPANLYSTKFSILTITRSQYNNPEVADVPSETQFGLQPHYAK